MVQKNLNFLTDSILIDKVLHLKKLNEISFIQLFKTLEY